MKYKLAKEPIKVGGRDLYLITALTSFADVEKGDLGGYVEHVFNLSHEGDAWVYDFAKVSDRVRVSGNAKVRGRVEISGCGVIEHEVQTDY